MPKSINPERPLQSKPYQITRGAERLRSDPLNLMRVMPPKGGFRFSTLSLSPYKDLPNPARLDSLREIRPTMNLISSKLPKIQFITHSDSRYTTAESALLALSCGIRWIQFRLKHASLEEARPEAVRIQELCRSYKALFVIDDHVELARDLKADGVHLGKTDMPIAEARKILGPDYLVGGTANTWEDMLRIKAEGGDYIGLGPYRFTTTKENLSPVLGIEGYRSLMEKARQNQLDLPVYAIGGLQPQDCKALMECGVHGIAISSAILRAEDPQAKTKEFAQQVLYY